MSSTELKKFKGELLTWKNIDNYINKNIVMYRSSVDIPLKMIISKIPNGYLFTCRVNGNTERIAKKDLKYSAIHVAIDQDNDSDIILPKETVYLDGEKFVALNNSSTSRKLLLTSYKECNNMIVISKAELISMIAQSDNKKTKSNNHEDIDFLFKWDIS